MKYALFGAVFAALLLAAFWWRTAHAACGGSFWDFCGAGFNIQRTFGSITSSTDANTNVVQALLTGNQDYEYAAQATDMNCQPLVAAPSIRPWCVALHYHANFWANSLADFYQFRAGGHETRNYSNFNATWGQGDVNVIETMPGSTGRFLNAVGYLSLIRNRGGSIGPAINFDSQYGSYAGSSMGNFTHFHASSAENQAGGQGSNTGFQADNCVGSTATCFGMIDMGPHHLYSSFYIGPVNNHQQVKTGQCTVNGVTKQCLYVDN